MMQQSGRMYFTNNEEREWLDTAKSFGYHVEMDDSGNAIASRDNTERGLETFTGEFSTDTGGWLIVNEH